MIAILDRAMQESWVQIEQEILYNKLLGKKFLQIQIGLLYNNL